MESESKRGHPFPVRLIHFPTSVPEWFDCGGLFLEGSQVWQQVCPAVASRLSVPDWQHQRCKQEVQWPSCSSLQDEAWHIDMYVPKTRGTVFSEKGKLLCAKPGASILSICSRIPMNWRIRQFIRFQSSDIEGNQVNTPQPSYSNCGLRPHKQRWKGSHSMGPFLFFWYISL